MMSSLKIFFSVGILLTLVLSCREKSKYDNEINQSIVIANIADADGIEVVLSVKGEDFENRQHRTIQNGQVVFAVPLSKSDVAWIEFEYNLDNYQHSRHFIPLILEKDTVEVSAQYVRDSILVDVDEYSTFYRFEERSFSEGSLNRSFDDQRAKIYELTKGIIYSHDILDSLNSTIFPTIRNESFELFDREFAGLSDRLRLGLLDDMLHLFAFEPEYLNRFERESIKNIFDSIREIDSSATFQYNTVAHKVGEVVNFGKVDSDALSFTDFRLQDAEGKEVVLSDLIKKQDFTVLYFWFAGCGPCRKFNNQVSEDLIVQLADKGIQLLHISTDFYRKNWREATKEDSIFWTNLYGGAIQNQLESAYKINGYPTKVVLNKNFEVVDFSFTEPEELITLGNL